MATDAKTNDRKIAQATMEGRDAAREPYAPCVIPVKYHRKPELGDAWYRGFMERVKA